MQQAICDLATRIQSNISRNDVDGLLDMFQPKQFVCKPANTGLPSPPPAPQPTPDYGELHEICAGAAPGQSRPAYIAGTAGEGFPVGREQLRQFLETYLLGATRADRARADLYGSGEAKIGSLFCNRTQASPPACDLSKELAINITYIGSGAAPFPFAGERTTFTIWVQRDPAGQMSPFGIGQSIPPNHVLTENVFRTTLPDGSVISQAWYAWTP